MYAYEVTIKFTLRLRWFSKDKAGYVAKEFEGAVKTIRDLPGKRRIGLCITDKPTKRLTDATDRRTNIVVPARE